MRMKSPPTRSATASSRDRRAFMLTAGTVLSGSLAAAAVAVTPHDRRDPARDDAEAIHDLDRRYGEMLNARRYTDLVDLFAADAQVELYGGVFVGRRGVSRLYAKRLDAGPGGARLDDGEPAHAFMLVKPGAAEPIEFGPDRRTARAQFTRPMQVEAGVALSGSLADMARQQGQGTVRWWEDGVYDVDYVKERGVWKIRRLAYRSAPLSVPPPGSSGAAPRRAFRFTSTFPHDPRGPDRLVGGASHSAVET